MAQPSSQSQPAQPAPSNPRGQSSSPRTVSFVVDRDLVVPAEIIRENSDGTLDLRGKFGQPRHEWKDVETTHETTGEKEIFAQDVATPDPRESIRSRVRQADPQDVKVGRHIPGTWFENAD